MSTSTGKNRRKLSKAELKAYRARRAAERQRVALAETGAESQSAQSTTDEVGAGTSYTMTRDDEWLVIKMDLRRLLIIVAVLIAIMVILTILLR